MLIYQCLHWKFAFDLAHKLLDFTNELINARKVFLYLATSALRHMNERSTRTRPEG